VNLRAATLTIWLAVDPLVDEADVVLQCSQQFTGSDRGKAVTQGVGGYPCVQHLFALSFSSGNRHKMNRPCAVIERGFADSGVGDFGIGCFEQIADGFVVQSLHGGILHNARRADPEHAGGLGRGHALVGHEGEILSCG
jgi:hypothetical protein